MITGEKIAVLAGFSVFAVLAFTLATRGATARTPRPGGPAKGSAAAAKVARSLFEGFRDLYSGPSDLRLADTSQFTDLDIPWLDKCGAEAMAEGFRPLGDYFLHHAMANDPKLRVMFRVFASPDGSTVLMFMSQKYRHPWMTRLRLLLNRQPASVKCWLFQTYFRDGRMLMTGTAPALIALEPLPDNKVRCLPPTDSWRFGLDIHRKELLAWLEDKPASQVVPVINDTALLEREAAAHARTCDHWLAQGYLTPTAVRNMLRLNRPFAEQVVVELEHILAEERAKGTIPPAPESPSEKPEEGLGG